MPRTVLDAPTVAAKALKCSFWSLDGAGIEEEGMKDEAEIQRGCNQNDKIAKAANIPHHGLLLFSRQNNDKGRFVIE